MSHLFYNFCSSMSVKDFKSRTWHKVIKSFDFHFKHDDLFEKFHHKIFQAEYSKR